MSKRTYRVGEPCDDCGTPTVQGKNGAYCKPCYINWKNSQPAPQLQPVAKSTPVYQQAVARDFNKEARGKIRHGLFCAFIQGKSIQQLQQEMPSFKSHLLDWENTIMNGVRQQHEKDFIQSLEEEFPIVEYPE